MTNEFTVNSHIPYCPHTYTCINLCYFYSGTPPLSITWYWLPWTDLSVFGSLFFTPPSSPDPDFSTPSWQSSFGPSSSSYPLTFRPGLRMVSVSVSTRSLVTATPSSCPSTAFLSLSSSTASPCFSLSSGTVTSSSC